ncbi:hypothetical protein BJ322DRAFT_524899 [Thelephora terrestris]|uniref:NACHT domain-containing protein n=1 Tax=Thelephora terrestris TaxID=56493 RepID=A0A9P6LAB9_9AGAM|nr:hypothetical protein BJ322DRAFT_524899 [Thelephora terrestris]
MSQAGPSTGASRMQTVEDALLSFPKAPAHFFGRDDILDDLLDLAARPAPATLYAAGGMGKTAIALTLLHHEEIAIRFGKYRYFIRCDALENSVDDLLGRLSEAGGFPRPKDVAQLVSHFEASPTCILVLDGIDSIIDPLVPGATEITTTIEELGRCPKVCLVATSRIDVKIPGFWRMRVSRLSKEAARATFHSHCSLKESAGIDDILSELSFHPLSIALLASAAEENEWDQPALLEAWSDGKTSILKASDQTSLEDSIESILRTPTIQAFGATARETLEAIAKSPGDVQEAELSNLFPEINGVEDAVRALRKFSLLYREDGLVKMVSPFRLYFQHFRRLAKSAERPFLRIDSLIRPPPKNLEPRRHDSRVSSPNAGPRVRFVYRL